MDSFDMRDIIHQQAKNMRHVRVATLVVLTLLCVVFVRGLYMLGKKKYITTVPISDVYAETATDSSDSSDACDVDSSNDGGCS